MDENFLVGFKSHYSIVKYLKYSAVRKFNLSSTRRKNVAATLDKQLKTNRNYLKQQQLTQLLLNHGEAHERD